MIHLVCPNEIIQSCTEIFYFFLCKIAKNITIKRLDFILNFFIKFLYFPEYHSYYYFTNSSFMRHNATRARHLIQISLTVKRPENQWCTDVYYDGFARAHSITKYIDKFHINRPNVLSSLKSEHFGLNDPGRVRGKPFLSNEYAKRNPCRAAWRFCNVNAAPCLICSLTNEHYPGNGGTASTIGARLESER